MLPAEKNERVLWRVCLTLLVLMALYIVIWIARNVYHSLTRIEKAYDAPKDEGRAPIVRRHVRAVPSTPPLLAFSIAKRCDSTLRSLS